MSDRAYWNMPWENLGVPTANRSTFFVDPRGRLRYLALGGRPWGSEPYRQFLVGLAREKRK